jgi:uncharacterized protein YprB with RNaseH-like and TPR domain
VRELGTLADKFGRIAALRPARLLASRAPVLRAPYEEDSFARLLGAGIGSNRYGEHVLIRNWFSTPELTEPAAVTLDLLSRTRDQTLSRRTRAALADPTKWLFLDTETTGIAGGAGTYAFLVGIAWWDAGGIQVEQFFMRDFADEHSILHELAARLAERSVLVTFNGKAFDWPLLENRFVMTRSIAVPRLAAHLDLLHPARALWKLRLGSVRLVELERNVMDPARLGWDRQNDIASAQIPQHYFDYLRGGPAAPMAAVVRHNQLDLRGLAALLGKIDSLLATENPAQNGQNDCDRATEIDSLDLFGLSRFLKRRGDSERAHSACAHALDLGLPGVFSGMARRDLAILAKRRGDHESAARLWLALADDEQNGVHACEQLAIHYERRDKDFRRALEFTQLALSKLRHLSIHSRDPVSAARALHLEETMQTRLARLQRRISASGLRAPDSSRLLV